MTWVQRYLRGRADRKRIPEQASKQIFKYDSPVCITAGLYQGLHGKIKGDIWDGEYMIRMPGQPGCEGGAFAWIKEKYLRIDRREEVEA